MHPPPPPPPAATTAAWTAIATFSRHCPSLKYQSAAGSDDGVAAAVHLVNDGIGIINQYSPLLPRSLFGGRAGGPPQPPHRLHPRPIIRDGLRQSA